MFEARKTNTRTASAFALLSLIYHSIVRDVRKSHRNAIIGLLMSMLQMVIFVMVFYLMFSVLDMRGAAIRGDFLLYLMTGVFLFLTHTKGMMAVIGADGPSSAMMKHAPMTPVISIAAAALSALYQQILAVVVVLYIYHIIMGPITILDPVGCMGMVLLAWFTGVAIGLIFLSIRPWAPAVTSLGSTLYARANMIASGKMFVANTLPGSMLAMFDWNPLFHCIDQARGFAFINYSPHFSSISYPIYVALSLLTIGMMLEFYTRKHASISWEAAR